MSGGPIGTASASESSYPYLPKVKILTLFLSLFQIVFKTNIHQQGKDKRNQVLKGGIHLKQTKTKFWKNQPNIRDLDMKEKDPKHWEAWHSQERRGTGTQSNLICQN